ncbi:hypothetical protein ACIPVK_00140 [Paeniglutamicibacter sp. MACA_103]|uniref:hypothetical protein n=1 Tax=Paeniglutamicibacter sp. MACA_103 TaxID=3377337 RepID=UPI0038945672
MTPEWLIASMALIFDEPSGIQAHRRIKDTLRARQSISLLAEPVSWGELSVIEMVVAVNPEGFIVMADESGEIAFGQQIEGFAIALKRGTGARWADFDGVDAESGEPVGDEALEHPTGGRSVLLGSFKESEVALFAGATKTAWHHFSTEHGDVAVHEGYMPEIMLSKSSFPAIMLSRLGPRFSMVFWFEGQSRKLHGYPGFGHGWSVAAQPVLDTVPGTRADEVAAFLTREWLAPDLESIAELSTYGIGQDVITQLNEALAGSGSVDKLRTVLEIFGRSSSLADYVEEGPLPQTARLVEPRGIGGTIVSGMRADARAAKGIRKFFNVLSWRPRTQVIWGVAEALVAVALVVLTDWRQPWWPFWAVAVIAAFWGIDALTNIGVGAWRMARARRSGR